MHDNFYLGVPFVLAILVRSIIPSGCRQTQPGCPTMGVHCVPACARASHAAQLRKSSDVKTAIFGLLSFTVSRARGTRGASYDINCYTKPLLPKKNNLIHAYLNCKYYKYAYFNKLHNIISWSIFPSREQSLCMDQT